MGILTLKADYIWPSGASFGLKTRILSIRTNDSEDWKLELSDIPHWTFSSSEDSEESILRPIFACIDPNKPNSIIILCDLLASDFTTHRANHRAQLLQVLVDNYNSKPLMWFVQSYKLNSLIKHHRLIDDLFLTSCVNSQLSISSLYNYKYEIGLQTQNIVEACDHLIVSRYLLSRASVAYDANLSFEQTDNLSINFSTEEMRQAGGLYQIREFMSKITEEQNVDSLETNVEHSSVLQALYASYDRDVSQLNSLTPMVSIPIHVERQGCGYLTDIRPCSYSNPYRIAKELISLSAEVSGSREPH